MEKCSKFPDPQIPPEPEPDGGGAASQPVLPTENVECQAGYTPLTWEKLEELDPPGPLESLLLEGHSPDCECEECVPWGQLDEDQDEEPDESDPISFDIETPASYDPRLLQQLAGAPQKISLPLDPHKGGEIHLSEEEVQLAKSQVSAGGEDSQSQIPLVKISGDSLTLEEVFAKMASNQPSYFYTQLSKKG